MNAFQSQVAVELLKARKKFLPINNLHEGLAVIEEEVAEFRGVVFGHDPRRREDCVYSALGELVQIAAMAQRVGEDVCLELATRQESRAGSRQQEELKEADG